MASSNPPSGQNPIINSLIHDTPRRPVTGGGNSRITELRPHIGNEMDGEFVLCDLKEFMNVYMPFDPTSEHVESCVKTLLQPDELMTMDNEPVFTKFPVTPCRKDSVEGKRDEDSIYQPLEDIAERIRTYKYPGRESNGFRYRHVPNKSVKADIPGSNNKFDACFMLDDNIDPKDPRISTWSTAVPIEHKVENSDEKRVDNTNKVVSANVQIMNDDIRRMFTFGITIEADQVTLWYHSRSHSAVSRPFNFVKDPLMLVSVFMSFLFATKLELGYDDTVQREADGQYIYKIPQADKSYRFYRTVKAISIYRSNNITGRMPRVWLVETYDPVTKKAGKKCVLKDVWLEANARTEGDIQTAIFGDIEAFWASEPPPDSPYLTILWKKHKGLVRDQTYKQLFLKIIDSYVADDTRFSKETAPGAKRIWGLHTPAPRQDYVSKGTNTRFEAGLPRPIPSDVKEVLYRGFGRKKQYRVIFEEVCQSVGDLETLGEVVDVIQQAHSALQLLYCAGWVHRDISAGNILAHRASLSDTTAPWTAKLMDLEYARKFPPDENYVAAADPKTGTPYFMPTEILNKDYLYNAPEATNPTLAPGNASNPGPTPDDNVQADEEEALALVAGSKSKAAKPKTVLIHNFQHDLESLWWIILWAITSHLKDQPFENINDPIVQNLILLCQRWTALVFQNNDSLSDARRSCFLYTIEEKLSVFLPEHIMSVIRGLEHLRTSMLTALQERVRDGKLRDVEDYARIHLRFGAVLKAIQTPVTNQKSKTTQDPVAKDGITQSPKSEDKLHPNTLDKLIQGPTPKHWRHYVTKPVKKPDDKDDSPFENKPVELPAPGKVKGAKRGPEQNPNVEEQGRSEGSQQGGKKSRRGK